MMAAESHPVPAVLGWAAGSLAGQVLLALVVLLVASVFSASVRAALAPLWRFTVGFPVFWAPGPWDAKWLYPAPTHADGRAAFRGEHYPRTRWGKMPAWRRMLWRWAAVGFAVALWRWPVPVLVVSGVVLAALVTRRVVAGLHRWALRSAAGLFAAGAAPLLGYDGRDLSEWIAVPRPRVRWVPVPVDARLLRLARRISERAEHWLGRLAVPVLTVPLQDDDARVRIALEATETRRDVVGTVKDLAVARLAGGPWEAVHHEKQLAIELRHPKRPPASVWYTAETNQQYPVDEIPIGQRAGGEWVTLPLRKLTPHGICAASTGWGKTTVANVFVAHAAGNGGRVFINDPKRIGFVRAFGKLPHVTIRSTVEGWVLTVETFHQEMQRRYEIIERYPEIEDDPAAYFQPWFLVTDERGSYVSEIKAWWKEHGEKGVPAPPLRQEKLNLWQARAAGMYIFDLAQQANLDVFLDSDGRDQRMFRIAAGPQTRSSWMMLFPGTAKQGTPAKKGRAILGIGPDHIEEIQLAQVRTEDAREFAAAGSAIAEMQNLERAERLAELDSGGVPPSGGVSVPGQTRPAVPGHPVPGHLSENGHGPVAMLVENSQVKAPEMAPESAEETPDETPDTEDLIIGCPDAAQFLGMAQAAFEKARQRRPIEGELRRGTRPAWPPLALREWRAQAGQSGPGQASQ